MANLKYKRILLKLSGEALAGKDAANRERSIDPEVIGRIAKEIAAAQALGIEVAVVVGGGNIFRGMQGSSWGMDKAAADYVGMLATIMKTALCGQLSIGVRNRENAGAKQAKPNRMFRTPAIESKCELL